MAPLKPNTIATYRSQVKEYRRKAADRTQPRYIRVWAQQRAEAIEARLKQEGLKA